jgi:hypothetical protein
MIGGMGRRMDVDHARGGLDDRRRAQGAPEVAWPARGEPFANGIGGARSRGDGMVLADDDVVAAARARARDALELEVPGVGELAPGVRAYRQPIPPFQANGQLAPGIVAATDLSEFTTRFGATPERRSLVGELEPVLDLLRGEGIDEAFVAGSMVTDKMVPADIDLAFLAPSSDVTRRIQAGVRALNDTGNRVHAYPADALVTEAPQLPNKRPGINMLEFLQQSREGMQRGLVAVATRFPKA